MRLFLLVSVLLILQVNLSFSTTCLSGTIYHKEDHKNETIWHTEMAMYAKSAGKDEFCSVRFTFDEKCFIDFHPLPANGNSIENCRIDSADNATICKCREKCVLDKTVVEEALNYSSGIEGNEAEICVGRWKNLDFSTIPKYGDLLDKKVQCLRATYKLNDEGKWEKHQLPGENEENNYLFCSILIKDYEREVVFTGGIESVFPIVFAEDRCDFDGYCSCSTEFCNKNLSTSISLRLFSHVILSREQLYELHFILNPSERTTTTGWEWIWETTKKTPAVKKKKTTTTTVAPPKEPAGPDPVYPKPVGRGRRRRRPDGAEGKKIVHVFLIVFFILIV